MLTFVGLARCPSLIVVEIQYGDILIVDISLSCKSGKIGISVFDGECTFKRVHKYKGNSTLKA